MTAPARLLHYYPGLQSASYEHPEDRRLLASIKAIRGFDQLVKGFFAFRIEPVAYAQNLTDNVRVTPRQYPRLYLLFRRGVSAGRAGTGTLQGRRASGESNPPRPEAVSASAPAAPRLPRRLNGRKAAPSA